MKFRKAAKRAPKVRKIKRRSVLTSNLTRMIFLSNFIGLIILVVGALALNRFEDSLVEARLETLQSQASTIASVMADDATGYGLAANLDVENAKDVLGKLDLPESSRVRLFDRSGMNLADSAALSDGITASKLAPAKSARPAAVKQNVWKENIQLPVQEKLQDLPWRVKKRESLRRDLKDEIKTALDGKVMAGQRYDKNDDLIVTVSQPIRRVQQVVGVITLESTDVTSIVNAQKRALVPIIWLAALAALLSSLVLTLFIALPVRRLARAAERVGQSSVQRDPIPDLSRRRDEIGDLSLVMSDMTHALYGRMDDVANFAADVAHEIKNPLTSLRSASDTLRGARTAEQRSKLLDIIENDVGRMDRLISDISKASKVDANIAKDTAEIVDVTIVLDNLAEFYDAAQTETGASVVFEKGINNTPLYIKAFESPFAQVLRNLIDNALTFSPKNGVVTLRAYTEDNVGDGVERVVISVEDQGPGIPPENLETIFERFYTERPKGAQFGSHSGLGLAICRQIMSAHRGEIFAQNSEVDDVITGAKFTIRLPRQTPAQS